jgi:predicted porin
MSRYILLLIIAFQFLMLCPYHYLASQSAFNSDKTSYTGSDSTPTLEPWGRIELIAIGTDKNIGIIDAGSRTGIRIKQKMNSDITLFGGIELSMSLAGSGGFTLSPDNSTQTGFLNVVNPPSDNVFNLRKGFVGADFNKYGTVSIGKQYTSYYDVAGKTDISENNSGFASFVFSPQGTDGGSSGTGRASNSVYYRNTTGPLKYAASAQFHLDEGKFKTVLNSLGGSVIYQFPFKLNIGAAYHQVFLDPYVGTRIRGLNANPFYTAVCANYTSDKWFFGVTYAYEENGDLTTVNDSTVVFSGQGLEVSVMWTPIKKWNLLCGVGYKQPKNVDPLINKDYKLVIYFYGLQFEPVKNILLFFEGAVDNSITETGASKPSNISVGCKFDF